MPALRVLDRPPIGASPAQARQGGAVPVTGHLVIVDTQAAFPIPAGKLEVIIGREDPVSSVFPDVDLEAHGGLENGVGRKHARLTSQAGPTFVEDLDTVNHTRVHGQVLARGQKQLLSDGDELMLGKLRLVYHTQPVSS
jgi:hypothetical protein